VSPRRIPALERIHIWAAAVWLALIGGGGFAFVVRDLLGAGRPLVALAWLAGAALLAAPALVRSIRTARGPAGSGRGGGGQGA
jgi:hypothetical protein